MQFACLGQLDSDDAEKINFFQLTRREAWGEEKIVLAKQLSGNSPYIFTDKTEKKCNGTVCI